MSKLRIAFLGPFGTFTEQALRQVAPENAELIPLTSPPLAMKAVREGKADWAVVPIENSIEGGVNATLDALADYPQLVIRAEMLVPITFHLAVRPGTRGRYPRDRDAPARVGAVPKLGRGNLPGCCPRSGDFNRCSG